MTYTAQYGIIHRIWMGGPMPDDYAEFGARWQWFHRGQLIVKDWTEAELMIDRDWWNQPVIDHLYERDAGRNTVELYVQLADVFSYELLYRYGGIYLNCDIDPVRPLTEEKLTTRTWLAREDRDFVVGAAMGTAKDQHPFFEKVLKELGPRYFLTPGAEMNQTTGPRLLTAMYLGWDQSTARVHALPVEAFNSVHWSEIPLGGGTPVRQTPAGAIGIHHWGHRRDQRTNIIEHGAARD